MSARLNSTIVIVDGTHYKVGFGPDKTLHGVQVRSLYNKGHAWLEGYYWRPFWHKGSHVHKNATVVKAELLARSKLKI